MKFKYVLCAMIIGLVIPTFAQSVNIVTNGTKIYEFYNTYSNLKFHNNYYLYITM